MKKDFGGQVRKEIIKIKFTTEALRTRRNHGDFSKLFTAKKITGRMLLLRKEIIKIKFTTEARRPRRRHGDF